LPSLAPPALSKEAKRDEDAEGEAPEEGEESESEDDDEPRLSLIDGKLKSSSSRPPGGA
jgi:hypothetical protein